MQADFFEMALEYMWAHRYDAESNTINALCALAWLLGLTSKPGYGALEDLAKAKLNLEDALTIVDLCQRERVFRGWLSNTPMLAMDDYLVWFTKLLTEVLAASLGGQPCALHRRLASCIRPGDTVISYNYDTLVDEALQDLPSFRDSGYFIPFWDYIQQFKTEPTLIDSLDGSKLYYDLERMPISRDPSPISLLKLHGSLNWLKCRECETVTLDKGLKDVGFMRYLAMTFDYGWLGKMSYTMGCSRCNAEGMDRVVIPPLLHKTFSDPIYTVLWQRAKAALASAQRIVVIGYSLPPADFHSRMLFQVGTSTPRFRSRPAKKETLIVVDPEQQVAARLRATIPHVEFHHYLLLEDFLLAEEQD